MRWCFNCFKYVFLRGRNRMVRQAPAGLLGDSAGLNGWMNPRENILGKFRHSLVHVCLQERRSWTGEPSVSSELPLETRCWKPVRVFAQGSSFKPFHGGGGRRKQTASVLACLWRLSHSGNFNSQAFKMKRWWQTVSMNETQLFITLDYGSGNITASLLLVTCHIWIKNRVAVHIF